MSETRFTPGPWRLDAEEVATVLGPDGFMTADCLILSVRKGAPTDKRCRANAHLIAAAPDLYAAVKAAVEAYDEMVASLGDDDTSEPAPGSLDSPDITLARAALAKARGETP